MDLSEGLFVNVITNLEVNNTKRKMCDYPGTRELRRDCFFVVGWVVALSCGIRLDIRLLVSHAMLIYG